MSSATQQKQQTTTSTSTSTSSSTTTTQTLPSSDEKRAAETGELVVMSLYWDEWSRCISSRYQKDQLYRLGTLDGCSKQWKDVKIAGKAKLLQWKDPQQAQQLLASTYYKKRTTISPTAGAIWELKQTPGWD